MLPMSFKSSATATDDMFRAQNDTKSNAIPLLCIHKIKTSYPGKKENAVSKRVFKPQQKRPKTLFKV